MVYTKDANGEYTQPVRYMLCTTGSKKLGPTRKGIYPLKECRIRFGTFAGTVVSTSSIRQLSV